MIKETLLISDTNILLDMISVDLLNAFFLLPCEFYTTDFIIEEIKQPEQRKTLQPFIDSQKLQVLSFDIDEFPNVLALYLRNQNNASIPDCSVWYLAKKTSGRLLTGDGKLRSSADADGVNVSGILFVFDRLVEYKILAQKNAADLLERLTQINMRLPKRECQKRIEHWRA